MKERKKPRNKLPESPRNNFGKWNNLWLKKIKTKTARINRLRKSIKSPNFWDWILENFKYRMSNNIDDINIVAVWPSIPSL